ncbi:MAG: hypothetical protein JST41_02480 [Bacteroidetes bacterium]|nr:hypothetical protein [Bacteroidota bacterium]HMU14443.1 hypothetical protein [Flavobacteriales bacterium]
MKSNTDIRFFKRMLLCNKCGNTWLTAEVPEKFINELVELRDALRDIKANAGSYLDGSKKSDASSTELRESHSVLQALKIHGHQAWNIPFRSGRSYAHRIQAMRAPWR